MDPTQLDLKITDLNIPLSYIIDRIIQNSFKQIVDLNQRYSINIQY